MTRKSLFLFSLETIVVFKKVKYLNVSLKGANVGVFKDVLTGVLDVVLFTCAITNKYLQFTNIRPNSVF